MSDAHNDFVRKIIMEAGPGLTQLDGFSAQLVAIESILAGLMAITIKMENCPPDQADVYLSAVTHGARPRLRVLLK